MSESVLTFSWEGYQKNIIGGLCSFQQSQEFVDMTIAADGHFVKVHQMIISIVSPYIKDLIKSTPCQHPVIFLNRISYQTLSLLLEYIYTGEVMVPKECLKQFMQAGQELHIKGLKDLYRKINTSSPTILTKNCTENEKQDSMQGEQVYIDTSTVYEENFEKHPDIDSTLFSIDRNDTNIDEDMQDVSSDDNSEKSDTADHQNFQTYQKEWELKEGFSEWLRESENGPYSARCEICKKEISISTSGFRAIQKHAASRTHKENVKGNYARIISNISSNAIQYTVSNQGNLQMILNRFIYYLRYSGKSRKSGRRLWRCVDYIKTRCPASVVTKNNVVIERDSAHTHPFHDRRITKKVSENSIFSAVIDAEQTGKKLRENKNTTE